MRNTTPAGVTVALLALGAIGMNSLVHACRGMAALRNGATTANIWR